MNLRKLPREKRDQIIGVVLGTMIILGSLGFGLARWQRVILHKLEDKRLAAQIEFRHMKDKLRWADGIEAELADGRQKLSVLEEGLAPVGDMLSWLVNTLNNFIKKPHKVDIRFPGHPAVSDVNLLAKFPYRQVTFRVTGQACFHDFGKFLADFENQFPHIRVLNLDLNASSATIAAEGKLEFQMDIVALVKTNPT